MKIVFIAILAGIAVSITSCKNKGTTNGSAPQTEAAGNSADASRLPVIDFEEDTYDFGKIKEGEKVSYDFKFTNTGKSPLIISNASTSCGCTVPDYPHQPIAPGESGVIKVVFNSSGKNGQQHKAVTLTTNASPSTTEIFLVGEVQSATK